MKITEELMTLTDFIQFANKAGLKMSARRYRQLAAEAKLPATKAGKVDAMLAAVKIALYYREMAERQVESSTLTGERIRLTRIITSQKELVLQKEMEEILDMGEATYIWSGLMEVMKARLMTVPDELALALTGCSSAREAEAITRGIIHRVLIELSDPSLREVCKAAEAEANAGCTARR